MKGVFIYGTCQGEVMEKILMNHKPFTDGHTVVKTVRNFIQIVLRKPFIDIKDKADAYRGADVLIHQPLDDIYGHHSTSHILKYLKDGAQTISIPYVVNLSLWPFIMALKGDLNDDWRARDGEEPVMKNMEPIDDLLDDGMTANDILQAFDANCIDWDYDNRHKQSMSYMRAKEKGTDIKVCDFIESNLQLQRMFVYYSHLASPMSIYLANEVCKRLGVEPIENTYSDNHFFETVEPLMFPTSSKEHYNLKFVTDEEAERANAFFKKGLTKYLNNETWY